MLTTDITDLFSLTCAHCRDRIINFQVHFDNKSKDYLVLYDCHGEDSVFSVKEYDFDGKIRDGKLLRATLFAWPDEDEFMWVDGPTASGQDLPRKEDEISIADLIMREREEANVSIGDSELIARAHGASQGETH